ncbi:Aste57867_2193 [Aphanomyces stellatus]|uniref:Aste57867_2193 protein n=1 Tax=Aphanomyces stellatus TaxID=120398 RepID=A0A485KC62_9STRA|nr:hypothetical protein As57867_002188 [Aphanomyces stellatus]VFT79396.1 Aste57867_2193 [Aphanomyces stellatus]
MPTVSPFTCSTMGNAPVEPARLGSTSRRFSSSLAPMGYATSKRHLFPVGHILIVGLDGSGKTNLIQGLSNICCSLPASVADQSSQTTSATWTTSNPLPSRFPMVKSVVLQARELKLLAVPGARDLRYLWYSSLNKDEMTAICFCVDLSDATRFPLVALELQRLHEFRESIKLHTVWLMCTKSDCVPVKKTTAMDTFETLKKLYTQLTKLPCEWSFTLTPLVNSNLECSLRDLKAWIQEAVPAKP